MLAKGVLGSHWLLLLDMTTIAGRPLDEIDGYGIIIRNFGYSPNLQQTDYMEQ